MDEKYKNKEASLRTPSLSPTQYLKDNTLHIRVMKSHYVKVFKQRFSGILVVTLVAVLGVCTRALQRSAGEHDG